MQFLPEVMGAGVAWLDYDRDGLVDLLFVQSGTGGEKTTAKEPASRLYRNLGSGRFADVTDRVGLLTAGYGQGVAVGDYDNDGFPDLFISNVDGGQLFHNEPGGEARRFRDVTRESGLALDGWCSGCAFGDLHGTGRLDLFVCRYVAMDRKAYPECIEKGKAGPVRTVCGPQRFEGLRSYLFRNDGNGKFTDVSAAAGLEPGGKALGVVIFDLDDDGKADIFVGNDTVLNHHYQNLGGGKFRSVALRSGTAATVHGRPMGSMGVEVGDLTGHGLPDLFVTTYLMESTVLYRNRGRGFFTDVSESAGMFAASRDKVGWGTGLFDADLDGNLDLVVANGHTHRNADELQATSDGRPQRYAQLAQAFTGDGHGRFREVSATAGPYFQSPHTARGVAVADYDNDGRVDVAVTHVGGPPAMLRNVTATPHHWVRLELEGSSHRDPAGSNRDAVGATVSVKVGDRTLVRHLKGGGSYYSAQDRRLVVGVGPAVQIDEVSVRWPNAARTVQRFGPLAVDRGYRLLEGVPSPQPEPAKMAQP
ncbi:CRTAC1 family protein [Limnoglobus roseus]|uniref:CRTAC1 family protein n=1 Tax=Limnoglobus roseus TaxID=2598579 RepID=A0A5C1A547_9BACT|nr:CRTAC1 family protein [Limnoglobus roseus]QEL13517.1 CRTAC1 family protein [Limnoglobus roseus]